MGIRSLRFLFLIFTLCFPLSACNLRVAVKPQAGASAAPASEAAPFSSPTAAPTAAWTLTPSATATPFPTFPQSFNPTEIPTPQWSACPLIVAQTSTKKGQMLSVLRCEDGLEYELGPLALGVHAVGPNNQFLIYAALDGVVYGIRIGQTTFRVLYDLQREGVFTALNKGIEPDFRLSFSFSDPIYYLIIIEKHYDQKRMYALPVWLTQ